MPCAPSPSAGEAPLSSVRVNRDEINERVSLLARRRYNYILDNDGACAFRLECQIRSWSTGVSSCLFRPPFNPCTVVDMDSLETYLRERKWKELVRADVPRKI